MCISPQKRVMDVLNGEMPDRIPFTVYETLLPSSRAERELRNRGLCIIQRTTSYHIIHPNVTIKTCSYVNERKIDVVKTIYSTPFGDLSTLIQPAEDTTWTHEHMFKTPDDYKALLFYIKDSKVVPSYEQVMKLVRRLGDDFLVRDSMGYEPMQALISMYMGTETFCMEWMDHRDEIIKLYQAMVDVARRIYPVVADGPLALANYGGNVVPQIIGRETFKNYYAPHYNEAAEIMHQRCKLIGCHFDADNTMIMKEIGETALDYIEAYDAGVSPPVETARKAWPDKTLWLNWPSSWHLLDEEEVYSRTIGILKEAGQKEKLIIGITENAPDELWQRNYARIMDAMEAYIW
jgi:hypothetical protein